MPQPENRKPVNSDFKVFKVNTNYKLGLSYMYVLHAIIIALLLVTLTARASDADAIILQSKIIDAETNQPIEGAVVMVVWWRSVFFPCMDSCIAFQDAAETTSDANGEFSIDISMGWLSKRREIVIYKPKYHLPGDFSAPWLRLPDDPPPDSRVIRLIKIAKRERPDQVYPNFSICSHGSASRFCVPRHKIPTFMELLDRGQKIANQPPALEPSSTTQSLLPPDGVTPVSTQGLLHEAAWLGNAAVVKALISLQGADPNLMFGRAREPPLYAAIRSGDIATVETLIRLGADPNVHVPKKGMPLDYVKTVVKPEIAAKISAALLAAGGQ